MTSVDDYLAERGGSWSENTLDSYTRVLKLFSSEIESPEDITAAQLRSWLDSHGWGDSMRWVAFSVVRGYMDWAFGAAHPALKLRIKRRPSPPQRSLSVEQVKLLLESFDTNTAKGIRDLAITTLLLDTGLRVSELCNLRLCYVDMATRTLQVQIKGGQWSFALFSEYTSACMQAWVSIRAQYAQGGADTVFVSIGGIKPGKPLTRHGVLAIMRGWAKKIGLKALAPHDFRRTFATLATRAGAPSRVVQAAGRWSNLEMVERYTKAITPEDLDPYFPVNFIMF